MMLTKRLATWTFRQKMIAITVLLVGTSIGYVVFRYRPRTARIEQVQREADRMLANANKAKPSEDGGQTPDQLERQLAQLEKELAARLAKLATLPDLCLTARVGFGTEVERSAGAIGPRDGRTDPRESATQADAQRGIRG